MMKIALCILFLGAICFAQPQPAFSTSNTDPVWNTNIFHTNPPMIANDQRFNAQMAHSVSTCYSGATSVDNICYVSSLGGTLRVMNQSASDTFAALILLPTSAGMRADLKDTGASQTNLGNTGDFVYVFLRLSDFFPGVRCGASLNQDQASCVLDTNQNASVPNSFVTLPVSAIFNAGSVLVSPSGTDGQPVPEPSTLLLLTSGAVLALLRLRNRRVKT